MTYRVLRPKYEKTGEVLQTLDGPMYWQRVTWVDIGSADSMEDAKRKYGEGLRHGRAPVLEWVGKPH